MKAESTPQSTTPQSWTAASRQPCCNVSAGEWRTVISAILRSGISCLARSLLTLFLYSGDRGSTDEDPVACGQVRWVGDGGPPAAFPSIPARVGGHAARRGCFTGARSPIPLCIVWCPLCMHSLARYLCTVWCLAICVCTADDPLLATHTDSGSGGVQRQVPWAGSTAVYRARTPPNPPSTARTRCR